MRQLLAALGDPQHRFRTVLIAGSNGKGSTSALLAAMVQAAGYRTALYTSPHLETVEERLRVDGRVIDRGELAALLTRVVECGETRLGNPPTYFEALTAAAFLWFAEQKIELAVVEVGMGGRLDATNLCEPLLALITSISLEHREHLGNTLDAIAREKAGILRRGRPVLTWIEAPEAASTVRTIAAALAAPLHEAVSEVAIEAVRSLGWAGQQVRLTTPTARYDLLLPLLGAHQTRNLGLAVRAAELLGGIGFPQLDGAAIAGGTAACRWPGRLEPIVLPGGGRVLLDAAHNPEGAAVLASFLSREVKTPVDLLFGVLDDKDGGAMLRELAATGRIRNAVLTSPASPRARNPEQLRPALPATERQVLVDEDPAAALEKALAVAGETLLACGSIYLVGEVRQQLRRRYGVPPPAASAWPPATSVPQPPEAAP
jgi:dihydrofolate synthase/folylpolyglutamate synthase